MTIARRLLLLLLVPIAGVLAIAIFNYTLSERIEAETRFVAEDQSARLVSLAELVQVVSDRRIQLRDYLRLDSPDARKAARDVFDKSQRKLDALISAYETNLIHSEAERAKFIEFRSLSDRWRIAADEVMALKDAGDNEQASELVTTTTAPIAQQISDHYQEWVTQEKMYSVQAGQETLATIRETRRNQVLGGIFVMVASALVGYLISRSISRPINALRKTVETIAKGNYALEVPFTNATDETGSLARSIDVLKAGAAEMDVQQWIKASSASIATKVQTAASIEVFGEVLLSELTPLVSGCVGLFSVINTQTQTLHQVASFGLPPQTPHQSLRFGEGLAGQCAFNKRRLTLSNLPPAHFNSTSAVGTVPPTSVDAWPLLVHGSPVAILEIASFTPPAPRVVALMEELLPVIALILDLLSRNLKTNLLLEETRRQASDLQEQQAALLASEQQFRTLLEAAPDALIISAENGKILRVNAQAERLLGYKREELIDQPIELLVPSRFRSGHPAKRHSYHHDPTIRDMGSGLELSAVRKDGSEFAVEISLSPLEIPGHGRCVCSSMRDITQRKQVEAEIKRINFMSDSALDLTKAGYWHVPLDNSGFYNSSERAARIFGDLPSPGHRYSLEEWARCVREGDEEAAAITMENFRAAVAGEIPVYNATYAYKRPIDGRIVWIHALGNVVKDEYGKPTDMYGVTQDITEFKALESDLRLTMKKAEEATQAKSSFLANMSHEIRTPMNGIMGMTELALDTELTAEQRDYLNTVKSSADALLSLINDILDFSKIEAGRIELDPIEFLLRDAMGDTLSPLSLRASTKGVELAYEVHADVPDALVGDVYRLRQVIVNLVGNAIKFTEKGEVVLGIRMLERKADDVTLEVSVRDTGIGISPEAAARLFKAFEQAESSTTRKYGGTGLGLAISKQLVELMGGEIRLESQVGVGSSFIFTVKMKVGVDRPSATTEDAARLFKGKTALIVDDNLTNLRILGTMLSQWGLKVMEADSGSKALVALDRAANAGQSISIIISDLHMPEMDGFEVAQRIKAHPALALTPIMLLTSSASTGDQARCTQIGIGARLLKPIKPSLLLDNVMRMLEGANRRGPVAPSETSASSSTISQDQEAKPLKMRVLLAEDNPVNQKFAIRVLESAGHAVTVAHNGREAVEKSALESFDVILMDIQMPEMDGLDATRAIRARENGTEYHIPIIAMTANAMKGDREMCIDAGMDGYVPKPVKRELLFAEVQRVFKELGRAEL